MQTGTEKICLQDFLITHGRFRITGKSSLNQCIFDRMQSVNWLRKTGVFSKLKKKDAYLAENNSHQDRTHDKINIRLKCVFKFSL